MEKWKLHSVVTEGSSIVINGINVLNAKSEPLGTDPIKVANPNDLQQTITINPRIIKKEWGQVIFAVTELSNGVYCCYVQE